MHTWFDEVWPNSVAPILVISTPGTASTTYCTSSSRSMLPWWLDCDINWLETPPTYLHISPNYMQHTSKNQGSIEFIDGYTGDMAHWSLTLDGCWYSGVLAAKLIKYHQYLTNQQNDMHAIFDVFLANTVISQISRSVRLRMSWASCYNLKRITLCLTCRLILSMFS